MSREADCLEGWLRLKHVEFAPLTKLHSTTTWEVDCKFFSKPKCDHRSLDPSVEGLKTRGPNWYIWFESSPLVPGHEIIGHVAAVGQDVSTWKVGDRIGGAWHGGHDG